MNVKYKRVCISVFNSSIIFFQLFLILTVYYAQTFLLLGLLCLSSFRLRAFCWCELRPLNLLLKPLLVRLASAGLPAGEPWSNLSFSIANDRLKRPLPMRPSSPRRAVGKAGGWPSSPGPPLLSFMPFLLSWSITLTFRSVRLPFSGSSPYLDAVFFMILSKSFSPTSPCLSLTAFFNSSIAFTLSRFS